MSFDVGEYVGGERAVKEFRIRVARSRRQMWWSRNAKRIAEYIRAQELASTTWRMSKIESGKERAEMRPRIIDKSRETFLVGVSRFSQTRQVSGHRAYNN